MNFDCWTTGAWAAGSWVDGSWCPGTPPTPVIESGGMQYRFMFREPLDDDEAAILALMEILLNE